MPRQRWLRLQRFTTNTQRCNDVNVKTLKVQRSSHVVSVLEFKFNSQYAIDFIMKILLRL